MKVANDPVGIVYKQVGSDNTIGWASQATDQKTERAPRTKSIGVGKVSLPPHIVAIQLKNLIPVGTATKSVVNMNGIRSQLLHPGSEHVVGPDQEAGQRNSHT